MNFSYFSLLVVTAYEKVDIYGLITPEGGVKEVLLHGSMLCGGSILRVEGRVVVLPDLRGEVRF